MGKVNYEDIGEPVRVLLRENAIEILKAVKERKFPIELRDFFYDNRKWAFKAIKVFPETYFELEDRLQRDKGIVEYTIRMFNKQKRLHCVNSNSIPLKRKEQKYVQR